jgi:cytochrome P450/NADPH-cytochrome P450 reductase
VRCEGTDRALTAGPAYRVGRDPNGDIVLTDPRVSWQHAVLRVEDGRWVLADAGSTNGTFTDGRRVQRVQITGECLVRLGHPVDGAALACTAAAGTGTSLHAEMAPARSGRALRIGRAPGSDIVIADPGVSRKHAELRVTPDGCWIVDLGSANGTYVNGHRVTSALLAEGDLVTIGPATFRLSGQELREAQPPPAAPQAPAPQSSPAGPSPAGPSPAPQSAASRAPASRAPASKAAGQPAAGSPAAAPGSPREIPYAVRWLVPRGERFANFPLLNDNDTQLAYYRRFGHVYAVGVPAKKWRLVVVSDPELLDEVADNEEQFGKRVEEINFFAQLRNSRGAGLSVIGDGGHYERVRRVMLPWYAPSHQRTQFPRMKEQARKLVAAWAALPAGEPVDARAWVERYTLEVSGRGACNYDFGLLAGTEPPHPFAVAVPESTKESIRRVADPYPDSPVLLRRADRARRARYRAANAELFATAAALVSARRHASMPGHTDLLSRLLTTPDPETGALLDEETVRDQVLMHLSNGFNGPAITGGWLAFILATRPDVAERMLAETDAITGGEPGYDLAYDDLMRLTYTTQVIKETLRVYPPMPVTIRRSLKDGTLGPYRVRKDDIILIGTLAAQRDPRYWGPDPDRFDPEHFSPERAASRPRHAFIPFSIGKRQCMAQEVTFMMLRVLAFEICKHYRLRLAPGATVVKNTVVTTKPGPIPVILAPRAPGAGRAGPAGRTPQQAAPQHEGRQQAGAAPAGTPAGVAVPAAGRDWGEPTEIPADSAYRHLVIAYGSNFGANRELAEQFAGRGHFHGYTSDVLPLDDLTRAPLPAGPWLLAVFTATYTGNPPSNAAAFRSWLDRAQPGPPWQDCRYLVWGLGNSQWNAFLAFPRWLQQKLSALGATPLADLGYADVGTPAWERQHEEWNSRTWPVLLELSGARPTEAAAQRAAAARAAAGELTGADSGTAMHRSLLSSGTRPGPRQRRAGVSSVFRSLVPGQRQGSPPPGGGYPQLLLAPEILTNPAGIHTAAARVTGSRELQAPGSPKRTRHLELALPPGLSYRAGDHLGVCPVNDPERVTRVAQLLGAAPDGLFVVPETLPVRAVPKGVVLQVRNVLGCLADIGGRPPLALVDLLAGKAADPAEQARLAELRDVLADPDGPPSPLRAAAGAGGFDVASVLEACPPATLNIFEFLQVAQPLRPRYYSPSSSPGIHGPQVAHLTVGLEESPVPGMEGHRFRGVSSHYLHRVREGEPVQVFLDSAVGFHLQEDVTKPMIFVSAGTGFAPMRAFLWERLALQRAGTRLGEAAMFNGIRSASLDYLYREEVERLSAQGVLSHVEVAASREQPGHREYVQDRIRARGALVWRLISEGGYVYVCGSQPMRRDVRAAFVDVIAQQAPMPHDRADAYLSELETTTRYRPDLWG